MASSGAYVVWNGFARRRGRPNIPIGNVPTFVLEQTKPEAGVNVGILNPSSLTTTYTGPAIISTNGTVLENMIIPKALDIRASNVIIRNCLLTAAQDGAGGSGKRVIAAFHSSCVNLIVEYCELAPATPSVTWDGIAGHDYTLRYSAIHRSVDGAGVYNGNTGMGSGPTNVRIYGNHFYGLSYFSPDPNHSDNKTHNDPIQVQGGQGTEIIGNRIDGLFDKTIGTWSQNGTVEQTISCIMITPNGPSSSPWTITDLIIRSNWFYGAGVCINGLDLDPIMAQCSATITKNKFDHNQQYGSGNTTTTISINKALQLTAGIGSATLANRYEDNGVEVLVRRP